MQDRNPYHISSEHALLIEQAGGWLIPSLEGVKHQELEGDYVDLLDIAATAQPTPSHPCHPDMGDPQRVPQVNRDPTNKWTCGKALTSEEGACTPCLRRKLNRDLDIQETKCRFRQSYVAALKNPVSFGSVPMNYILEEQESRTELPSTLASLESAVCYRRRIQAHTASSRPVPGKAEPRPGDMANQGPSRIPKSSPSTGSDFPPSLVHRFSFLRGQRSSSLAGDGLTMDANSNQYGSTWRRVSAVCSPRLSRVKFSGKGTVPSATSALEVTSSVQKVASKTGLWVSIVGSPLRGAALWEPIPNPPIQCQDLSAKLLYSGIACLPGSRDKLGRALIQVTTDSTAWEATWCSARELARLLLYLCSVARKEVKDLGLLVLVDARTPAPTSCLHAALQCVQASSPGSFQNILFLVEKEAAAQLDRIPGLQVEVLTSVKSLSRYVEIGQLTWDLGGTFPYCHSEWVQFYQKLDTFLADLRKASELLQRSIQELGEGSTPQDSQEAEEKMTQYRELMMLVLSDSRLVSLQRDGGTTLARLRKEAARFCCSQDVRCTTTGGGVHALVTKSNRRLEQLELSSWIDGDGESQLHEMDTMEWSLETLKRYHKRFKDFFLQATVHYNHGLVLLDDANKFNGSLFPEMESFKGARSSFQTKLTGFYMSVERQKEELEKVLSLYSFCDKKLPGIMEELLATERDYVCSLGYVLSQYLCEMERSDLPPALRGQHGAVFGNLEKLYEFHSLIFLQELTVCRRDPCNVGRCFLKHKEQFGLYAFYSKNKPQSDRLLQEHGAAFFRKKQQELGDKMDLSSYLLKPIQRISKYSLLLQDMEWECKGHSTQEAELRDAQEAVRYQLRHGNDLLAMDDIQDCDVRHTALLSITTFHY
ncbi:hypothetical protein FKM82_007574 [Ascaphus truei]